MAKKSLLRPQLENCEARDVPSGGNVTVQFQPNSVIIIGDASPNSVYVQPLSNGQIRILGTAINNGITTINGKEYVDFAVDNRAVSIDLRAGNDRLVLDGLSSRHLSFSKDFNIDMNTGLDVVTGSYVDVGDVMRVNMGFESNPFGYESATFSFLNVQDLVYWSNRNGGSNSFGLTGSTVRNNLELSGTNGSDSINIASVNVAGSVNVRLGDESSASSMMDSFSMTQGTVGRSLYVNMGEGRASINLNRVVADTINTYAGSYSADQLTVYNTRARLARFDGGRGENDRITGSGNVFTQGLQLVEIERNELR